jgi:glutaredoxin
MFKKIIAILIIIGISVSAFFYFKNQTTPIQEIDEVKTQGLMLLIEFEDTIGLNNFVHELSQRSIPSLLLVHPNFIEENQENILELQDYNVEIAAVLSDEPLWDIPYEEQYQRISEAKTRIEGITGKPLRVIGSKYFAYDENTLKVAEDLGIEYVLGRGVTKSRATIFKPEEYNVKIFSVSNIDSPNWGTGSLCDYSYWAREGTPADFEEQLFSAAENYDKISPVSHTYIGGLKERWNDVYLEFFDNTDIFWEDLDQFGSIDLTLPLSEIPQNREVQYTTPKPELTLEEEINLTNPCYIDGTVVEKIIEEIEEEELVEENSEVIEDSTVVIFENSSGPMCVALHEFLEEAQYTNHEIHLNTDEDFFELLEEYKTDFKKSEGFSSDFSYYPIIFIQDRAFSGFDLDIEETLKEMLLEQE